MSVEVKTPTRTQFEYSEFPCGENTLDHVEAPPPLPANVSSTASGLKDGETAAAGAASGIERAQLDRAKPIFHRHSVSAQFQQPPKLMRKRRFSERPVEYNQPTFKGRRNSYTYRQHVKSNIVLPTKFLLGGNINDPLNLNSMLDEETNRLLNENTPHSSPVPLPSHRSQEIAVLIPPNITDPLNLNSGEDIDQSLLSPKGLNRKKKRKYNKKRSSTGDASIESQTDSRVDISQPIHIDVSGCDDIGKVEDKIVSPVITQTSPKPRKRRRTVSESKLDAPPSFFRSDSDPADHTKVSPNIKPKFKRQPSFPGQQHQCSRQNSISSKSNNKTAKFIFGNYNRYYGYRNPDAEEDSRLKCFESEWFDAKDVLDIGCNAGHLTLAIAHKFSPRRIVGIDIDGKLIGIARKNIRHYISSGNTSNFPKSLPLCYGPLAAPAVPSVGERPAFPNNVSFVQANYVLSSDEQLELQREEYDVILALSITKWIHFNWGDAGLKRFFRRVFRQLRPGGLFILESQAWVSYKKKKKLTDEIFENFKTIQLRPEQFTEFLLSEVGFSTCQTLRTPVNKSKGFQRPIQVFTKSSTVQNTPCHIFSATPSRLPQSSKPSPLATDSPSHTVLPLTSTPCSNASASTVIQTDQVKIEKESTFQTAGREADLQSFESQPCNTALASAKEESGSTAAATGSEPETVTIHVDRVDEEDGVIKSADSDITETVHEEEEQ